MKLYTKRGDAGQTDLFGGQRVDKDALRVDAFGTVDEINAALGLADAVCDDFSLRKILRDIQARLFDLGADLATPMTSAREQGGEGNSTVPRITADQITDMEKQIDAVCDHLPAMTHFILPGGCELASRLHLARTICRRAERLLVALKKHEAINDQTIIYLNRLSDLLFALARRANQIADVPDISWHGPRDQTGD